MKVLVKSRELITSKPFLIFLVLLYIISSVYPLSLHLRYLEAQNLAAPRPPYMNAIQEGNTHPINEPDRSSLQLNYQILIPSTTGSSNIRFKGDQGILVLHVTAEIGEQLPYHEVISDPNYVDMGILQAIKITTWSFIIDEQHVLFILTLKSREIPLKN